MSLLGLNPSPERIKLAKQVLDWQCRHDIQIREFDERQKNLMLEDVSYSIECLSMALKFESGPTFREHARWLREVLVNRLPQHAPEGIKQMLIWHYRSLRQLFAQTLPPGKAVLADRFLQHAIEATAEFSDEPVASEQFAVGPYAELRREYLAVLLGNDRMSAIRVIMEAHHAGIPVPELCVDVLQPVMYQVGQLWQQGELTVGQEHRSALITQAVMARLSAERRGVARRGKAIVACSAGAELHEIGVRMICEIFELNGWDSFCPGAAVPLCKVLQAVDTQKADLLALSVTMPIHLDYCFQVVKAARERFDNLRIAVGGRPFLVDPDLWRRWPADICVGDAAQFVEWANQAFGLR